MKVTTAAMDGEATIGSSVELANNEQWAKVTLHTLNASSLNRGKVQLDGTPRELRKLARTILEGLKRL